MSAARTADGRGRRRGRAPVDLARERRIRAKVTEMAALIASGAVDPERTRAMLAGELPTMTDDVPTSIRAPRELLARADALAEALAGPGAKPSRSAVLRAALERGIAAIEEDRKGGASTLEPTALELRGQVQDLQCRVEALARLVELSTTVGMRTPLPKEPR